MSKIICIYYFFLKLLHEDLSVHHKLLSERTELKTCKIMVVVYHVFCHISNTIFSIFFLTYVDIMCKLYSKLICVVEYQPRCPVR
jgi:hypothetical protein